MVETTEKTGEKTLSVTPTKTLTLKGRGVEQGVVRQSFSHGRTKQVLVEKVKSRTPIRARADVAPAARHPVPPPPTHPQPAKPLRFRRRRARPPRPLKRRPAPSPSRRAWCCA